MKKERGLFDSHIYRYFTKDSLFQNMLIRNKDPIKRL